MQEEETFGDSADETPKMDWGDETPEAPSDAEEAKVDAEEAEVVAESVKGKKKAPRELADLSALRQVVKQLCEKAGVPYPGD